MTGKTIVISAVNIRKGGTLTILRDCLKYLSENLGDTNRVVALVHDSALTPHDNIEFIEFPDSITSWKRRLQIEYREMMGVSEKLGHVDLWLSLHDTTPNVHADVQAVYCQTSFPFLKWHLRDGKFDPKIPLFAMFTRFAYRVNVHRNRYLIVQQNWLREGLGKMLGVSKDKFLIFPPKHVALKFPNKKIYDVPAFGFVSTADCHKNFETLCRAAEILEKRIGKGKFKVILSISGEENKYAAWLKEQWGAVDSIEFKGFLKKDQLMEVYSGIDCLVFPSRVETWGLPITEFAGSGKPMILADLPYAHETAQGCGKVAFYPAEDAEALARLMEEVVAGNTGGFGAVPSLARDGAYVADWRELFARLLAKPEGNLELRMKN